MGDARRRRRHGGSAGGVAWIHPAPAVDEDLAADLLGDRRAVGCDGPRLRRWNPGFEIAVGRVLGRNAKATPPEHAVLLASIVQPSAADLFRRGHKTIITHG